MKYSFIITCFLLFISFSGFTQNQEPKSPQGFFTLSAEISGGHFYNWNFDEKEKLRIFGDHTLRDRNKQGHGYRFAINRVSKNEKLAYGIGFYRYVASKRYDTTFTNIDGTVPRIILDGYRTKEAGNVLQFQIEPRLYNNNKWSISGQITAGISWLQLDDITTSSEGGPVSLRTLRNDNAKFMELHTQFGLNVTRQINPFNNITGGIRYNYEASTDVTLLLEAYVGVGFILKKGGKTMR